MRANIPTEGWIGGPGTEMAILNRNPESPARYEPARRPIVFVYELKHDLNAYLRDWLPDAQHGSPIRTLADIIAFNRAHADAGVALRPGHLSRRRGDARRSVGAGIPRRPRRPICAPAGPWVSTPIWTGTGSTRCCFPAPPGPRSPPRPAIPSVQVPAGFVAGATAGTPAYPFGATFTGRAWSEPMLLRLAYAFEQASLALDRRRSERT